jgi:hypothetical protein
MLVHTENAATLPDTHVTGWTTVRSLRTTPRSAWPELSAISTPYEIGRSFSDRFSSGGFGDVSCAKTGAHDATASNTAVAARVELGVQQIMRVVALHSAGAGGYNRSDGSSVTRAALRIRQYPDVFAEEADFSARFESEQ